MMPRIKGTVGLSATIERQAAAPVDATMNVATRAELLLAATWQANDGLTYCYVGQPAVVAEDGANNGWYILLNPDYTQLSNWLFIGPNSWAPSDISFTHTFSHGDASPTPLLTAVANLQYSEVEITITEAFDGVGASLTIGDVGDNERVMLSTENAPGEIGRYTASPQHIFPVNTLLNLYINPGSSSTMGRGILTIRY